MPLFILHSSFFIQKLLLLCAAPVLFTACKDDDGPPECQFAEARAEIYMYDCPNFCDGDTVPGLSRYQDTLIRGRALFYSLQPADSCIWWIGSEAEPRYGNKVEVMFDGEYSDVRIRLICIRTSTCNGETRRSVDTTDHYIQVVEFSNYSMVGTYRGRWSHLEGEQTVVIKDTMLNPDLRTTQALIRYNGCTFLGIWPTASGIDPSSYGSFTGFDNTCGFSVLDIFNNNNFPHFKYYREKDSIDFSVIVYFHLSPPTEYDTLFFSGVVVP